MSEETQDDEISFGWMALMYPHEVYATYPERFWQFFQQECPGVSREEMERLLKEDEETAAPPHGRGRGTDEEEETGDEREMRSL